MDASHPSEIAAALLAQHRALRELLEVAVECARHQPVQGEASLSELVGQLADDLEAHNRHEEVVLGPLLREADAWGPERIEQMLAHHHEEHIALVEELRRLGTGSLEAAAAGIDELAGAVRGHMDAEEKQYLNLRVLRDDLVALDAAGS